MDLHSPLLLSRLIYWRRPKLSSTLELEVIIRMGKLNGVSELSWPWLELCSFMLPFIGQMLLIQPCGLLLFGMLYGFTIISPILALVYPLLICGVRLGSLCENSDLYMFGAVLLMFSKRNLQMENQSVAGNQGPKDASIWDSLIIILLKFPWY